MALANESAWSMRRKCDVDDMGYSQPYRWATYPGGTMDCSSGCAHSYNEGGIQPPFPLDTYTGNFRAYAAERGFAVLDYAEVGPYPDNLAVGDSLLSEAASGGVGHIAMVTGYNEVSEAWIAETGDIDGAPGDQTGNETRTVSFTGHPYTAASVWTHVLRPPADGDDTAPTQTTPTTTNTTTKENDSMYLIRTDAPWGDPVYATINLSGIGGASAKTQAEADVLYSVIGVCPIKTWEKYNELIRLAWVAHNEALASIGQTMGESIDDAVRRIVEATRPAEEVTA